MGDLWSYYSITCSKANPFWLRGKLRFHNYLGYISVESCSRVLHVRLTELFACVYLLLSFIMAFVANLKICSINIILFNNMPYLVGF